MNIVLTYFHLFLTENKNITLENTQCEIIRVTYKVSAKPFSLIWSSK